jgi:TonB-linked SusC/RagA family outer membrane protein
MKKDDPLKSFFVCMLLLLIASSNSVHGQLLASTQHRHVSPKLENAPQSGKNFANVLKDLESRYQVSFSYDRKTVENKYVDYGERKFKSLKNELDFLADRLGFTYEKLHERVYLLVPHERAGKAETSSQGALLLHNVSGKPLAGTTDPISRTEVLRHPLASVDRISGKVVSKSDGVGLPGVSILVKGSQVGTVSDSEGRFSLDFTAQNPVLIFSYIGFKTQEVSLAAQSDLLIEMEESTEVLQEAVVTALGIKREKRSLGYSVGNVNGDALTETPQSNVLNALTGKVSGVQISQMSGSAGSSVNIVIRGANSLNGDNQPLFVIDGVPVANQLNNAFNGADMGNPISDINPNDIANISVLKGPSAAALYGSRAGNGVVLITTKSGTAGKKGVGVSFNTSTVMDFPFRYLEVQNKFASGKSGAHAFEPEENESWGPRLDVGEEWVQWNTNGQKAPLVSYPNRFKDFFQKGWTNTNNAAVSGNYEKGNFRLSLGNMTNTGVIPNTDLSRLTIGLNSTYNLTDRLRATANINITQSGSKNRPIIDGGRTDVVRSLYETGAQVNILDMKDYWVPGSEGLLQRKYKDKQNNPYFVVHENLTGFKRDRTAGKIQLDYDITDDISVMGRYTRDSYTEINESKIAYNNYDQPQGGYTLLNEYRNEENIDFMISYKKNFNDAWSLNAMVGANRLFIYNQSVSNVAQQLTLPGLYTISNGAPGAVSYGSYWSKKLLYGLYGSASLGFKDMVYLDVTARNDWSSTLPKENRSYFYPSVSVSGIVSEMVDLPTWFSFAKVRAGFAQVGNDVGPYSLNQTFATAQDWGATKRMFMGGVMRNPMLKPEISTSSEIGADLKFFNNRVEVEGTYYVRDNRNQVLSIGVPVESGATNKMINAGLVQSKGWELGVSGSPIVAGDFRWDLNLSFSRNRTYIKELAEGIKFHNFVSYNGAEVRTYEGGQIGDIFMRPVLTVKDANSPYYGYPILTQTGLYQTDNDINNMVKIGNFNHDVMVGIQPTFTYKAFSLYANIDWRQGGSFYSNTMMFLGNNGMIEETLSGVDYDRNVGIEQQIKANPEAFFGKWIGGRNAEFGGLPWPVENNRKQDASMNVGVRPGGTDADGNPKYIENLGGPTTVWLDPFNAYRYAHRPFPDRNLYSASYVKLREIAVTYHLPKSLLSKVRVQRASFSVVGNNLFVWTKANNGVDPERAFRQNGASWVQGVEYYNVMPWTGSLGFKLNVDF